MKRRNFIKLSAAAGMAILFPNFAHTKKLDLSRIHFLDSTYSNNGAQTIMIFLYGGASQLGGNLSNLDEIEQKSQNSYSYFNSNNYFTGGITKTENNCWKEAGGSHMEALLMNGDMTLFRCCFSKEREKTKNKAHGACVIENQRGSSDHNRAGMVANLAQILENKGAINKDAIMPFVTLEGTSGFYAEGYSHLKSFLRPVQISEYGANPFMRRIRYRFYYTNEERASAPDIFYKKEGGFDPALDIKMEALAQRKNTTLKIKEAFAKRKDLEIFYDKINNSVIPSLGENAYLENKFSNKVATAVKVLVKNSDTKVVTLGTDGLGGWDDHASARNYITRSEEFFRTLRSAMAHIKAEGKEGSINIMVFGDFGRNVNLNNAKGWDHGNLQNFYVLGGKDYFNHQGVVGETVVTGKDDRIFLQPRNGTYQFDPFSIAATLYKIYGIENPEILTDGYGPINI